MQSAMQPSAFTRSADPKEAEEFNSLFKNKYVRKNTLQSKRAQQYT
jgi:hypothetical protein